MFGALEWRVGINILFIFSLVPDKFYEDRNGIKNDSSRNQTPLISGILTHPKWMIF